MQSGQQLRAAAVGAVQRANALTVICRQSAGHGKEDDAHFRATSSFSECTSGFSTTKCVAVLGFSVLLPFMPEQRMMSNSRLRCDQPSPGPAFNYITATRISSAEAQAKRPQSRVQQMH